MKISSTYIVIGIAILGVALLIGSQVLKEKKGEVTSGTYTQFAQCLKEKGATFYGAFWCPHCQEQKALFGDAVSELPYVECSTEDKQGQTQICIDEAIKGYPTWKFSDGSVLNGLVPLQTLAEKTSCTLPL